MKYYIAEEQSHITMYEVEASSSKEAFDLLTDGKGEEIDHKEYNQISNMIQGYILYDRKSNGKFTLQKYLWKM